jgi:hypothetical protein
MNKLKVVVLLVFLSLPAGIYAQDVDFTWNVGSVDTFYDSLNNMGDADLQILRFNWRYNNFSIGFNFLDMYGLGKDLFFGNTYKDESINVFADGVYRYSFLPLEMAFVPLHFGNWLFLSVYGKAGWLLTQHEERFTNGFYGSAGAKLFLFPIIDDSSFRTSLSLFIEYDTYNRLKIGFGVDLGIFLALIGGYDRNNTSHRYNVIGN